ncbi:MAG: hypothetical protein JNM09_27890, partial [Blastocatellia bacterium]|nr:hypothetical protein [Blastocatellia bacterium]
PLGTATNNGVNSTVNALVMSGSDIYEGLVGLAFIAVLGFSVIISQARRGDAVSVAIVPPNVPAEESQSIKHILNSDGTLKLGAGLKGSFETKGYRMELAANGAPRFVAAAPPPPGCDGWDSQFSLPNGTNGSINVVTVGGYEIIVGGTFTSVGNITANNVARFGVLTNTWVPLGTATNNGVNSTVNALVMSGSDIYVGGAFTTADVGGTNISANRVAKYSLGTGWSALGTGGGNGVDNVVRALALSGTNLYVGGLFTTTNVGGTTVSANRVAKVVTTTGVWTSLGSGGGNGVDNQVNALALNATDLYIGGTFLNANVGGTTVPANRVARFNLAGNNWFALGTTGNGVNNQVFALALNTTDLYIGGQFTTADVGGTAVAASRIARFNLAGNSWLHLGAGPTAMFRHWL